MTRSPIGCVASAVALALGCASTGASTSTADPGSTTGDDGGMSGGSGGRGIGVSTGDGSDAPALGTNGDVTVDPVAADCATNDDCPGSASICTVAHKCGPIVGPCTRPTDCQNDSYCCDETCRLDQRAAPVCVPGFVPPRLHCEDAADGGGAPLPDLTGRFQYETFWPCGGPYDLTAAICNRGASPAPAGIPVAFYRDGPELGQVLTVLRTSVSLSPNGECRLMRFTVVDSGVVVMSVNDDGTGQKSTAECRYDNDAATVFVIGECPPPH